MTNKKISALDSISMQLSDRGQLTPSVLLVPAYTRSGSNATSNGVVDLVLLVGMLYSKVALWAQDAMNTGDYEEPTTPSGGGGDVTREEFNSLKNRVASLENNGSSGDLGSFPTHIIRVVDLNGNTSSYNLPCGPESEAQTIVISLNGNYTLSVYVTVSNVTISGTSISATVVATATKGNVSSATLSLIKLEGSFICDTGGGSGNFSSTNMLTSSLTISSSLTFSKTITATGATGNSASVYIKVTVNGDSSTTTTINASTGNTANRTIYVT